MIFEIYKFFLFPSCSTNKRNFHILEDDENDLWKMRNMFQRKSTDFWPIRWWFNLFFAIFFIFSSAEDDSKFLHERDAITNETEVEKYFLMLRSRYNIYFYDHAPTWLTRCGRSYATSPTHVRHCETSWVRWRFSCDSRMQLYVAKF